MSSHILVYTKEFTVEKALTNTRTTGKSSARVCTLNAKSIKKPAGSWAALILVLPELTI